MGWKTVWHSKYEAEQIGFPYGDIEIVDETGQRIAVVKKQNGDHSKDVTARAELIVRLVNAQGDER